MDLIGKISRGDGAAAPRGAGIRYHPNFFTAPIFSRARFHGHPLAPSRPLVRPGSGLAARPPESARPAGHRACGRLAWPADRRAWSFRIVKESPLLLSREKELPSRAQEHGVAGG